MRRLLCALVLLFLLPLGAFAADAPTGDAAQKKAVPQKKAGASQKKAAKKERAEKPQDPASVFASGGADFPIRSPIDAAVIKSLSSRGLSAAAPASDAVLLRRAYLDLTGTIPTPEAAAAYLADKSPDKYEKLVDFLLKSDDFNRYWPMRIADVLRVKSEFPINLWPNAAQAYNRYIYKSVSDNAPYDVFVKKMLCASGSNFRVGEVNFYRAMQSKNASSIAASAALMFMNTRYEKLPEQKRKEFDSFFERVKYKATKEWKEEIVYDDPADSAPFSGVFPDGKKFSLPAGTPPRAAFADWLAAKGNPYFSRAAANRVWAWMFGSPIVSPVDDMFAENPPVNAELLEVLASSFEDKGFDLRSLIREIALSSTYRQSPVPRANAEKAVEYFGAYPVRQLDAEVLIDAICKVTGSTEIYESTTPEPYTTMPDTS